MLKWIGFATGFWLLAIRSKGSNNQQLVATSQQLTSSNQKLALPKKMGRTDDPIFQAKRSIRVVGVLILAILPCWRCTQPAKTPTIEIADHQPDPAMLRVLASKVIITPDPEFSFSCDTMRVGVLQHLDRNYTYDVVPSELVNGLLVQGIHRPVKGTSLKIDVLQPATIYFFFHTEADGGFGQAFAQLPNWTKCDTAPAYDIRNGDHGLHMTMYKTQAEVGMIEIPATTQDRACFNLVVK